MRDKIDSRGTLAARPGAPHPAEATTRSGGPANRPRTRTTAYAHGALAWGADEATIPILVRCSHEHAK